MRPESALDFEAAGRHFPRVPADRLLVTGTPLRQVEIENCPSSKPLLVICGGSGGARPLNVAVHRKFLLSCRNELHAIGASCIKPAKAAWRRLEALYEQLQIEAEVVAFVPQLPQVLANASLVVCRAGGSTLAELAAAGVPSILCPYPFAADDHQRRNAEIFCLRPAPPHAGRTLAPWSRSKVPANWPQR